MVITSVFFGWALFGAWEKQYKRSEEAGRRADEIEAKLYDGRPVFVLETRRFSKTGWSFYLTNCGHRTARYVQLGTQKSRAEKYELHFLEVPVLEAQKEATLVSWWVSESRSLEGTVLDAALLFKFLNDVRTYEDPLERAVFIWFDVPITFRDMNEVPGEAVVRFCFDLESQMMKAAAVPYTERPAKAAVSSVYSRTS